MSRKLLTVLLLALTVFASLYAEDTPLTGDQARIYNQRKLSVATRTVTNTDNDRYYWDSGRFSSFSIGVSKSVTTEQWDAYMGPDRISKADFFRIAGYPDYEAICLEVEEQNRKKQSTGSGFFIAGGAGLAAGTVMMCINSCLTSSDDQMLLIVGASVACLSAIPMGIGIALMSSADAEPDISPSFAFGIADIYNQSLKAEIILNY